MKDYRRIYPPAGRTLLDGGKNSKFERSIIPDNESPDCANVIFTNGSVATREGVTKLNTTSVGSFVFDGLYTRRSNTNAETMIAWANGTAYTLGGTTFTTIPSAQGIYTAGVRIAAAQQENDIFFGNGNSIPYKWNGAEFTRHGVYPPTVTSTVNSQTAGTLTGGYRYKVTNVNSNLVESDVGPASTTFTAASATLRVTLQTYSVSYGVNARRLYRTTAGGTSFKRVIEISDNTTTTYDDNILDASLGVTAPTDNGVPPMYSTIVYHQSRLFMNDSTNGNQVWYTELDNPFTVASTNFVIVGDNATDIVKGLAVFDNSVVVFCERSVWLIYMPSTDSSGWRLVKAKSSYGSKSPFALIEYDNKILFPAVQGDKIAGFGALDGASIEPSSTLLTVSNAGSDLKSDRVEPDIFQIQETYLPNISGIIFKNKAYLSVTYGSGNSVNNRIYVMDFSISNLSKHQHESWVPWTGLSATQFTIYSGKLYFASSLANGFVYQMESGVYSDDGVAIDSYIWTKEFSGYKEDTHFSKDFRFINVLIDNAGDYFMNLTYRVDSDLGTGTNLTIDLDPGGSLWGVMNWGIDLWGGGSSQREERLSLGTARGQRVQFKFSNQNTVNQRFKVHGLGFIYNKKGYR